jgi:D-alanine-D-alanine ligase
MLSQGRKLRVGVIFGSRSVEHEVSIITALQAMAAMDPDRYEVIPLYLTKQGRWLTGPGLRRLETFKDLEKGASALRQAMVSPDATVHTLAEPPARGGWVARLFRGRGGPSGDPLEIDVAFPCVHGTYGEDGTLQGLLELAGLPYTGSGVLGSAVGMDKIAMKALFAAEGLPIVRYRAVMAEEWEADRPAVLQSLEDVLRYPLFVKPANLGSSIGIGKARTRDELVEALAVAASYDRRLLVEESVEAATEINCAVLGGAGDPPQPSVCEEPLGWQELLSYEDKYLRGGKAQGMKGATRRIPAQIAPELAARVQELAVRAFTALDCSGVARVDFLVRPKEGAVYVNEINTLPGSLSFYLWEPSGVPFSALIDRLIAQAFERHRRKSALITSYDTQLLLSLAKGTKSATPALPDGEGARG